jgi:hypothetical protein
MMDGGIGSETRRVSFQNKFSEISTSSWFYYKKQQVQTTNIKLLLTQNISSITKVQNYELS